MQVSANNNQKKSISINIPCSNILCSEQLKHFVSLAISRFTHFKGEYQGARVLIDLLEGILHVKIDYDPQFGILIIKQLNSEKGIVVFGRCAAMLEAAEHKNKNIGEDFRLSLEALLKENQELEMKNFKTGCAR
jgi:hypothetical protein